MFRIFFKYFAICICSLFFTSKVNNSKYSLKTNLESIIFSLICAGLMLFLRLNLPVLSILFFVFFTFCIIIFKYKSSFEKSLFLAIISTALGFIFYFLSVLLISPIMYLILQIFDYQSNLIVIDDLSEIFLDTVAILLCFLLNKNKRLILGFQQLISTKKVDVFLYISIIILSVMTILLPEYKVSVEGLIPLFLIIVFAITFFFLLKSKIMNLYLEKLKTKEFLELKTETDKLKADNEKMAYQIHKDNKILPVIQLTLMNLINEYGETDKTADLQSQLDVLIEERYGLMPNTSNNVSQCKIPSTEAIFQYFSNRGKKENINFEFEVSENSLSNCSIPINDLNTLICDLLENALIAVRSKQDKNILVSINSNNNLLTISVFDNGQPFAKEVLERMGKERITTHSDTGGSGIGLMTIFEILNKYNGSFSINKCSSRDKYTKGVLVTFEALIN